MFTPSRTKQQLPAPTKRPRRGIALVFVLIFVIAMAALAMSSIFMASNANLLAKSYDRERDLKFAAEAALSIGKSRVNADPSILTMRSPGQVDTVILNKATLTGANGQPLTGIQVSVYVGPTGSTSGQFGRFSSIVAEARDTRGNGFIRRLELTQESFAKFAYWSNSESNGSTTIFFNNNDELWGPVWSNDTISIGTGRAIFHDEVGTAQFISGRSYGTYSKGYKEYQKPILLPSTTTLATLGTIANSSGWKFTSGRTGSQNESSLIDRIEFIAADLNGSGDSTDLNEGMFRVFTASSDAILRGEFPSSASAANVKFCGDWHTGKIGGVNELLFYPAIVHAQPWFNPQMKQGLIDAGVSSSSATSLANAEDGASLNTIMGHANARCYLPGDPHLVAVERRTAEGYSTSAIQKGGTDTTFTPVGASGSWKANPATPNAAITAARTQASFNIRDQNYLFPLDRLYNGNAKGVINFTGNVGVSGTLNGRVTLYANGSIVLLDDLRYANDPVTGVCRDILGMIADKDVVIANNTQNTPVNFGTSSSPVWRNVDDTKDFYIHSVLMALGTAFRVEDYDSGPTSVNDCDSTNNGRGCIYLSGGLIQKDRGAVGTSAGYGFAKRYSYDRCAVVNPPPYFPTTGRFQDNRYLELDPAGFKHADYFKSITPDP